MEFRHSGTSPMSATTLMPAEFSLYFLFFDVKACVCAVSVAWNLAATMLATQERTVKAKIPKYREECTGNIVEDQNGARIRAINAEAGTHFAGPAESIRARTD